MTITLLKTVWTAIRPGWSRKNFTEKVGIRPELMEGDGGVCLSNGKEKVVCRELLWAAAGKGVPEGGGTEADAEDLCLSASCLFALFSRESSSSMLNPHSSSILSLTRSLHSLTVHPPFFRPLHYQIQAFYLSPSPYYHKVKVSLHPFKKALHHMSITCVTESNQLFTLPPLQSFSEIQALLYLCFESASIWLSPLTTRVLKFMRPIPPIQEGFPSPVEASYVYHRLKIH